MTRKREIEENPANTVVDINQLFQYVIYLNNKVNSLEQEIRSSHTTYSLNNRFYNFNSTQKNEFSVNNLLDTFNSKNTPFEIENNFNFQVDNDDFVKALYKSTLPFKIYVNQIGYKSEINNNNKNIKTLFDLLETLKIKIVDEKDISDYLNKYHDLIKPLNKICKKARSLLGDDTRLALVRYIDPEIDDNYLTLYFRNEERDNEISEIIKTLKKFASKEIMSYEGHLLIQRDFTAATLTDEELKQYNDNLS